MSKSKGERKMVGVRLPVKVIAKLDELAMSTGGSRGDVIQELVSRAQVQERQVLVSTSVITFEGATREGQVDE